MLKPTHQEGGRTATIGSGVICFVCYPYKEPHYLLIGISLIVICLTCCYFSTWSDLDHNESNLPTRGLISHIFWGMCKKTGEGHRNPLTHSMFLPNIFLLPPILYIFYTNFNFENVELMYIVFCMLVSAYNGVLSHVLLDRLTIEGSYSCFAVVGMIRCAIKKKKFEKEKYKHTLVLKDSTTVIALRYPYFIKVPIDEFGRTGKQYEMIIRSNLQTVNALLLSLMFIFMIQPNYNRCFSFLHKLLS